MAPPRRQLTPLASAAYNLGMPRDPSRAGLGLLLALAAFGALLGFGRVAAQAPRPGRPQARGAPEMAGLPVLPGLADHLPGWSYRLRLAKLRVAGTGAPEPEAEAEVGGGPQKAPPPEEAAARASERLTVVVLGTDRRPDDRVWRTDTIMLISLDRQSGRVGLLSVPRDLWVDIPGYGQERLNVVDYLGQERGIPDAELVKETLALNLGLRPDRFVRVDLLGFVAIVDALGGIELAVDCPLREFFRDDPRLGGRVALDLEPGMHHLDGASALRYARSRSGDSDFARARRQQRVVRALRDTVEARSLLRNAPALWSALADHVETDMPALEAMTLALRLRRVPGGVRVHTAVLGAPAVTDWVTPAGAQVLLLDPDAAAETITSVLAPEPSAHGAVDIPAGPKSDRSPDAADSPKSPDTVNPPTAVAVFDATGRAEAGLQARIRLEDRGLPGVAARPHIVEPVSLVFYRPGAEGQAEAVAEALGLDDRALQPARTWPGRPPAARAWALLGTDWQPCPGGY